MKNLLFAYCLFALIPARAADLYNFRNLGFSTDGLFFAYANTVVQDGTGFPHATVNVVNVPNNIVVRTKSLTIKDDSSYEESAALRRVLPAANLESYQITPGENLGNDLGLMKKDDKQASFRTNSKDYSVILSEDQDDNAVACADPDKGSKIITVNLKDSSTQQEVILYSERYPPFGRYCSYDFKIDKVITNKNNLVVVLSYQSPGFEGPDTKYMVVTGRLP